MSYAPFFFFQDAPDGFSDAAFKEEMLEIAHIIDDAAEHEGKAAVEKQRGMEAELRKKVFAVKAPDGRRMRHSKKR